MIRKTGTYCFFALLLRLLAADPDLAAQATYDEACNAEAMNSWEKIALFTDRDMYAVNESIRFRSYYFKGDALEGKTWSRVLYLELVTSAGMAVASGKYSLGKDGSSGSLVIPVDATTGVYYLRSYTRWMRNFGPRSFCYVPLKIINPYRKEVLNNGNITTATNTEMTGINYKSITCTTGRQTFSPGEEVVLDLKLDDPGCPLPGSYCLTVVPAGLTDTLSAGMYMGLPGCCDEFTFNYLPDLRGISISGMVVNTADQSPAPNARLHFSLTGDHPGYFGTRSDDRGHFIQTLPDRTGIVELYAASETGMDSRSTILVDQEFASDPVPIENHLFTLEKEEEEPAVRMAVNMQLALAYEQNESQGTLTNEAISYNSFYGIPDLTILTDDYVDLPTMTEVFENLVPGVNVHFHRREPYLEIESINTSIIFYPPLLLVDYIPVFDLGTFLSIDPLKIKKIEVVNEVFVRGDMIFGGIIHLTTRQGDMAGIDLPAGSYFFDYQAFHPGSNHSMVINNPSSANIPDTRNTLYWEDHLELKPGTIKTIRFSGPSDEGEYYITVRGVSARGDIISGAGRFTVKNR